ncbi:MAG TPA: NUDIX domain-containing protein [Mycobacteriales bacterium]|nr:NUDIX domain-containing protein [Mycobacteriales bacterium]
MRCEHRHSVSVAGIVVDEQGRALLTRRRDNGHGEPPDGIFEIEETITDGVREETGLEVELDSLTGVYTNMRPGIVALVFRCRVIGGSLQPTDEASDFIWARGDQLGELVDEAYAVRVRDALTDPLRPFLREHDGVRLL